MKKFSAIGSTLTALLVAGSLTVPVFAASNPSDDASSYSYNTGQKSYAQRQAEYSYSDSDAVTNSAYSFNTGHQSNASRTAKP